MPRFNPEGVLRTLNRHRVDYVLIGGVAATLHGSHLRTGDVDVCPSREAANLQRLAAALNELAARVRAPGVPEGLPFGCDASFLAGISTLNLVTRYGDFDLSFQPTGTEGYEDLVQSRVEFDLGGLLVPTASLADVIRSKEAAGRRKDHEQLPTLRRLLDELQRDSEEGGTAPRATASDEIG